MLIGSSPWTSAHNIWEAQLSSFIEWNADEGKYSFDSKTKKHRYRLLSASIQEAATSRLASSPLHLSPSPPTWLWTKKHWESRDTLFSCRLFTTAKSEQNLLKISIRWAEQQVKDGQNDSNYSPSPESLTRYTRSEWTKEAQKEQKKKIDGDGHPFTHSFDRKDI
jgi:hypothetical protein